MCILFCTRTLLILPPFHLCLVNLLRSWSTQRPSFWRKLSSSHHTIWSVWMTRAHHLISPARRKQSSVISVIWNPSTAGTNNQILWLILWLTLYLKFSFLRTILVLSYSRKKLEENTWLLSVFQLFAAWFAWLWHGWWHCHAFLEKLWRFWEISAVSHWTVTGWVRYQW